MLKTAYIYPHNTPSIVNRGKIINYTKYFITDVFCVFKLALLMLLTGALMVGGLSVSYTHLTLPTILLV